MSDVIDKTIEVLRRDGWCRGSFTDNEGRHCLVGAMQTARKEIDPSYSSDSYWRAREAVAGAIYDLEHEKEAAGMEACPDSDTIAWNDDCATGVDDIIQMLQEAGRRHDLLEATQ